MMFYCGKNVLFIILLFFLDKLKNKKRKKNIEFIKI